MYAKSCQNGYCFPCQLLYSTAIGILSICDITYSKNGNNCDSNQIREIEIKEIKQQFKFGKNTHFNC